MKGFNLFKKQQTAGAVSSSKLASVLHDERLRSEIILNSIEDGVMLIDAQGIIQVCNPGAAAITGWPVGETQGLSYKSVVKLVDEKGQPYEPSSNPFERVFREKQTVRDNTAVLVSRANKQAPVSISLTPLLDESKEVTGAIAVLRDETQQRQEEKQRADFISTASHEMRTPITAIEGYLALALNDKVATIDTRARGYLEKAHASTQHLGKLFQDLLTSAKAEDGRLISHPVVLEFGKFLETLANELRLVAEKKGLYMDFVIGAGGTTINATQSGERVVRPLYYVHVDPDRMREVITNLFDNAVKYTPEGKILVGLTGNDQVVQCYIRDTGPGIPPDDLPHLFQKFYRVDNSSTRTIGGTGLGLFICKKVVELYNGRIWVESEYGKGSTFFINLPRLTAQQALDIQKKQAATISPMDKPL